MRVRYADDIRVAEREEFDEMIRELSRRRPLTGRRPDNPDWTRYEFLSKRDAIFSRHEVAERITTEQQIALRLYGHYGQAINLSTRKFTPRDPVEPTYEYAATRFQELITSENITQPGHVRAPGRDNPISDRIQDVEGEGFLGRSLTVYIDNIIHDFPERLESRERLYRIATVPRGVYQTERENPAYSDRISPGDIVLDSALWSTSNNADSVIYRYSPEGEGATLPKFTENLRRGQAQSREQILYVIQNEAPGMAMMNISGYKLPRRAEASGQERRKVDKDMFSSGERLIRSRTPFRVVAIQETTPEMLRRVVILKPVPPRPMDFKPEEIRNIYDGRSAAAILNARSALSWKNGPARAEAEIRERLPPPTQRRRPPPAAASGRLPPPTQRRRLPPPDARRLGPELPSAVRLAGAASREPIPIRDDEIVDLA